jgi:hypothetical protein
MRIDQLDAQAKHFKRSGIALHGEKFTSGSIGKPMIF